MVWGKLLGTLTGVGWPGLYSNQPSSLRRGSVAGGSGSGEVDDGLWLYILRRRMRCQWKREGESISSYVLYKYAPL